MDKNFISIDDLVRQRLGGGEEQERSGAWSNMRDLLDKEMPQEKDRAGFFFWRRMMSAVAVLVIIASITVGGYELNATRGTGTSAIDANRKLPASTAKITSAPANNNEAGTLITTQGVVNNNQPKNQPSHNTPALIAASTQHQHNEHKHVTAIISAVAVNTQKAIITSETVADNNSSVSTTPVDAASPIKAVAIAENVNNKKVTKSTHAGYHTKTVSPAKATAATEVTNNDVAKNTSTNDQKSTLPASPETATASITKPSATAAKTVAAKNNDNSDPVANAAVKPSLHPAVKTTDAKIASAKKGALPAPVTAAHKTKEKDARQQKMVALALSSSLAKTNGTKVSKVKATALPQVAKTTSEKVVAGNTSLPANKKTKRAHTPAADKTAVAITATAVANIDKISGKKVAATQPVVNIPAVATTATPKTITSAKTVSAADNAALKNTYAVNVKKNKRVIQKMVLFDHHIKTDPADQQHNLDTISIETLTQELSAAGETNPYLPTAKKSASRTTPATPGTTVNSNNNTAGEEVASIASTTNAQIVPGAAATVNGKAAGTASKQSAGAAALENLGATFNDIKYHVKGVQFAPGLNAGINGTFFGPTSFKGFQFGVTGDFIFSDAISLGAELKYFHRVNNNYSMEDDYYTYTGPAGGPYTKQQITNAYAFSTLHSLEMPLIVRYTAGKFSFFLGGNIVYSFSINEGASVPQVATTTTTVAAKGNDQNAKLDATDFNSRFGFGCLFGVSYKVAPNVSLDIRNVQTLWDNANSSGSKYVSDQLYRSPSLQLSLSYRLGNKKAK